MTLPAGDAEAEHPLAGWLRGRVAALRATTPRRTFPAAVELVAPCACAGADPEAAWRYGNERTDHGLRVEVLVRLLTDCRCRARTRATRVTSVTLVHVRPGPHEPTDADLGWAAAASVAGAIAGVDVVSAVALSRWGWYDLRTGQQRSWVRLRARPRAVRSARDRPTPAPGSAAGRGRTTPPGSRP